MSVATPAVTSAPARPRSGPASPPPWVAASASATSEAVQALGRRLVPPAVALMGMTKLDIQALEAAMKDHDFVLETVATMTGAREALQRRRPDLVLLDLDLADNDSGCDLITDIRARAAVPIIVVSTGRSESDAVAALDVGADDFLRKPFGADELLSRIRVALRHVARPGFGAAPVIRVADLEVDIARRRVLRAGQPIHLTPTEYRLLKVFATHPDGFLSDSLLINEVWGPGWRGGEHVLHVYVARLRKKVEDDPLAPRYLLTESGLGYRFAAGLVARPADQFQVFGALSSGNPT